MEFLLKKEGTKRMRRIIAWSKSLSAAMLLAVNAGPSSVGWGCRNLHAPQVQCQVKGWVLFWTQAKRARACMAHMHHRACKRCVCRPLCILQSHQGPCCVCAP